MEKSVFQRIARLWAVQFTLVGASSALLYGLNPVVAYSFALGAINFVLPNAYFALKALRFTGIRSGVKHEGGLESELEDETIARLLVQNFYRAQMNKFVMAATGFAVIFSIVKPINGLALFAGFIVMMICQWIVISRWTFD